MMAAIAALVRLSTPTSSVSWPYKLCPLSTSSKIDQIYEQASTSSCSLKQACQFPMSSPYLYQIQSHLSHSTPVHATLNNPKGFRLPPQKTKKTKKSKMGHDNGDEDDDIQEDRDGGVIPEVVTNRMMRRMGFSVGIPLFIGMLFFLFFYYLKTGLKIDVPTWVPFIVSFFFFGFALLGVSYGIVSSSWDPMREGSLLGWNEAQRNWPVFWQSFWGRSGKK